LVSDGLMSNNYQIGPLDIIRNAVKGIFKHLSLKCQLKSVDTVDLRECVFIFADMKDGGEQEPFGFKSDLSLLVSVGCNRIHTAMQ
jgi:hypothetical protein